MKPEPVPPSVFDGMEFSRTLPETPGVYRMFDAKNDLLYVGKARILRRRVSSYFQKTPDDPRIASMISKVARMEITVVGSEVEALVLESEFIRTQKPRYNIRLRDGSGYPYLHIDTQNPTPKLTIVRGARASKGRSFGPFPSGFAVREAHDALLKHFKLRTCSDTFFASRTRPCLEYQIGRCSAPCVGLVSKEQYRQQVKDVEAFLDGKASDLIEETARKMEEASTRLDFEQAAVLRDRIASLRHVQSRISVSTGVSSFDAVAIAQSGGLACASVVHVNEGRVVGQESYCFTPAFSSSDAALMTQFIAQNYLREDGIHPRELLLSVPPEEQDTLLLALREKVGIASLITAPRGDRKLQLDLAVQNAKAQLASKQQSENLRAQRLSDLVRVLGLPKVPERIECFDISHTMGESTVASCVAFTPDGPLKSGYRRYNITGITPGDDYAAMHQALSRRLNSPPLPDLWLIDGGPGQVQQAVEVCRAANVHIPIVGVGKGPARKPGEETLIIVDTGEVVQPGPASPALHLIQQIRDEAHRFAIEGHRKKREKTRSVSVLEKIPGIGPNKRRALLQSFGGLQGITSASVEDIARVKGIDRALAERIHAYLHRG